MHVLLQHFTLRPHSHRKDKTNQKKLHFFQVFLGPDKAPQDSIHRKSIPVSQVSVYTYGYHGQNCQYTKYNHEIKEPFFKIYLIHFGIVELQTFGPEQNKNQNYIQYIEMMVQMHFASKNSRYRITHKGVGN